MQKDSFIYEIEDFVCDQTFQNYCLGTNIIDSIFWEDWIKNNPHKQEAFSKAKRVLQILSARQGDFLSQLSALQEGILLQEKIRDIIAEESASTQIIPSEFMRNKRRSNVRFAAAACILIVFGSMLLAYFFNAQNAPAGEMADFVFVTKALQKKTIQLPDSSIIFLNENSRLVLDKDFNSHKRVATLEGEAYFDVKHDPAHPFLLHTAKLDIQVLGTAFNVKAYKETDTYEAALLRGKIEILPNKFVKQKIVLQPNQQFALRSMPAADKQLANHKKINIPDSAFVNKALTDSFTKLPVATKWSRHKMVFNNETLATIAKRLEEWYGIQIVIRDQSVADYRFTGTFDNENIINVLTVLQTSYSFDFYVKNNVIYISK